MSDSAPTPPAQARTWKDLSSQQRKSGLAAWLGWTFDGLDMHLYTLVATPFVAELLRASITDKAVGMHASIIQAAFLVGWALGGGFFGVIGDRLGRSRALCLTILTYACFTALSFFAQEWWHLLIFRFLAALGIGGEWAVGASLISETWPKRWRPWMAAVLQTGVNLGVLMAVLANTLMADQPPRYLFLVGVLPALLVLWIRKAVPEPEEWHAAKKASAHRSPPITELFRGAIKRTTILVILVCAASLTAHWAFMFWHVQQIRNLPEVINLSLSQKNALASKALYIVMVSSIVGNFTAALIARFIGFRRTIAIFCLGYFVAMSLTYMIPRSQSEQFSWLILPGFFQGLFALFTMYLPPLFPTLLRTTGAGFSYNIGRVVAAGGTIFFGLFAQVGDYRLTLLYAGLLFIPATFIALLLPELTREE